jgi:hypothetical protein
MLYRFATIGIVGFWMVMMGMLLRLEMHPEETDIMNVPVSYVARMMFKHNQLSLLTVQDGDKAIGSVSLRPSVTGTDGRSLDCSGSLSMQLPGDAPQRFNFHGVMDMDTALRVVDFYLDVHLKEPRYQLTLRGAVASKRLEYEVHDGKYLIASEKLPMEASAIEPVVLRSLGLPENAMSALPAVADGIARPEVTARETQITMHGERLQVYEVMVNEGTTPVAQLYVTQAGQVILGKTSFGYTITMEDYQ